VTQWTGESKPSAALVATPDGISYPARKLDAACRVDDILWETRVGTPDGTPQHAVLHPERQRRAMQSLRCAGCVRPASRTGDGMLWVLPLLADEMPDNGWEGVRTAIPPMRAVRRHGDLPVSMAA
jgi:hypothetical protein